MTKPEKTWEEFFDEGVSAEYNYDKIVCPFCLHEHYDDLPEYVGHEEFTCEKCGSVMSLDSRETTEFTTAPLVDNRRKETT